MSERDSAGASKSRALFLILSGSALLKLILAIAVRNHAPALDESAYLVLARTLATEGRFDGTFRPPLYPAFMWLWLALTGGTLAIRLAQVALSTASVWLVHRITERVFGERTALVAAAIFAFDPVLVSFTHWLWSETLFIFLLLLALDCLARPPAKRDLARWIGAGLALGLAALTRPMIVTFLPFLFLWAGWEGRTALGAATLRCAALGLAAGLVILPWTLRNYRATGAFILIDSNGPFNVLVGAQPEAAFVVKDDFWSERYGRVDHQAYQDLVAVHAERAQAAAMSDAVGYITADPGRFVRKSVWEALHLWTLDSFLLRHLRNGWYGDGIPGWVTPVVTLLSVGFFVGLMLSGMSGLILAPPSPFRGLALLLLIHSTLLFGATYALSRYSVPLHAVLATGAALVLASPGEARDRFRAAGPARRLALAAVTLLLLAGWGRDIPLMGDMLQRGGAQHRFQMDLDTGDH